jgi:hypothetical protein
VHIFCHRTTPYHFEEGDGWMAQTFFSGAVSVLTPFILIRKVLTSRTGGTMPSHDLLVRIYCRSSPALPLMRLVHFWISPCASLFRTALLPV